MTAHLQPFVSTIGPIITGRDVELAALAVLKRWGSTYLAEAERQSGRTEGTLPRIRAYTTAPDFEKWPEDQLPCVLLIAPGLADPPNASGTGAYRARWSLGIAAIVSTARADDTAELGKLYVATLRTCLLQHQSLEGFAAGITWLDENYDDLPSIDTRSLGAGQAIFAVEVEDVSNRWHGPVSPDEPPADPLAPLPDDPTATSVEVTTEPHSI